MVLYITDIFNQYLRRIGLDLILIPLAFYLAWIIRFDLNPPEYEWSRLIPRLGVIILVYVVVNFSFGVYYHLWAYASFRDVLLLSEAVGLSTSLLVLANFILTPYYTYRLSTGGLIIGGLLTLTLTTVVNYRRQLTAIFAAPWFQSPLTNPERVLIVGINEIAQQLANRIYLRKDGAKYEMVGFISSDPKSPGMNLCGIKILGTPPQIPRIVADQRVDLIVIAQQPGDREAMWRLIATCCETEAQVKVLPDVVEFIENQYHDPLALREVSVEDILRRSPAIIDSQLCERVIADKVVLVTGAAGSIGSELCRQILRLRPRLLLALDNNETGLYDLELELNRDKRLPLQVVMANVSDWHRIKSIFRRYRPKVVFHAAAYKHVPLVEYHPGEAFKVNVIGTVITSEAAHRYKAERFIFISTDKAVRPSSAMGASKYIGELWLKSMATCSPTIFSTVRFGNVIGSRGSVLPTFARQIELGGPITVTHPEMARFFMSIPEAVSLVLETATLSQTGQVFMLDMGEEVSILKLAQRMIRLKGLRVGKDIKIEFIGIRPGEKLHEELAYDTESKQNTLYPRIYYLQSQDEPVERLTLFAAISTMADCLKIPGGEEQVRQGMFHIAAYTVKGVLPELTRPNLSQKFIPLDLRKMEQPDPPGRFLPWLAGTIGGKNGRK